MTNDFPVLSGGPPNKYPARPPIRNRETILLLSDHGVPSLLLLPKLALGVVIQADAGHLSASIVLADGWSGHHDDQAFVGGATAAHRRR